MSITREKCPELGKPKLRKGEPAPVGMRFQSKYCLYDDLDTHTRSDGL